MLRCTWGSIQTSKRCAMHVLAQGVDNMADVMTIRSKVCTSVLAVILAVGGGSVAFGGSQGAPSTSDGHGASGHSHSLKEAGFVGTWTGQPPNDFVAVLAEDGSGTINFITPACSGSLSFVSFDGTVLQLRMTMTVTPGTQCVPDGVASATVPVAGSSTWTFVTDAGVPTTGTAVRAPKVHVDHSCDHADQKVAKLADHQNELNKNIAELNQQLTTLAALRVTADAAGNTRLVAKIDKRVVRIQSKIDQKTAASVTVTAHETRSRISAPSHHLRLPHQLRSRNDIDAALLGQLKATRFARCRKSLEGQPIVTRFRPSAFDW